ncbi:unnamed protein product [Rangifer tarandus platyrhynchus]|uniref:Uncharacterized protein n=1 Tax=Rangifer tarandus platyrhynchus TaxID=3082113 RepID=A0ABN8XNM6_RANTA|nr:unnamed protein product [Rangifer tarandus platyrhynchus]
MTVRSGRGHADCRKEADGARGPASSHRRAQRPTQGALGKVPNSARCHLGSGQPTLSACGRMSSQPSPQCCVLSQTGPSGRSAVKGQSSQHVHRGPNAITQRGSEVQRDLAAALPQVGAVKGLKGAHHGGRRAAITARVPSVVSVSPAGRDAVPWAGKASSELLKDTASEPHTHHLAQVGSDLLSFHENHILGVRGVEGLQAICSEVGPQGNTSQGKRSEHCCVSPWANLGDGSQVRRPASSPILQGSGADVLRKTHCSPGHMSLVTRVRLGDSVTMKAWPPP